MSEEYAGREQSQLKHRVLEAYLQPWFLKLGSASLKIQGPVRLWYIDCFAGPWASGRADLADTSVGVGLKCLEDGQTIWNEKGQSRVEAAAIFIGKNKAAGKQLSDFVAARRSPVECTVLVGSFGEHIATIEEQIGDDAAFVFVDPTGWKGADMDYIARLARKPFRDVLINVMYEHINRFKDDDRPFLQNQMQDFFGLDGNSIPRDLDERGLLTFYRQQLKKACDLRFVADIAVPFPDKDRTYFRLVIGGNHPMVLKLFRNVEEQVIGKEAAGIRANAAQRKRESSGQTEWALLSAPPLGTVDDRHRKLHDKDKAMALDRAVVVLEEKEMLFGNLWPEVLQEFHLTERALAAGLNADPRFEIVGMRSNERALKDNHSVKLVRS